VIQKLPADWKRPLGRPTHTWLHAVETDLGQLNIGFSSAWRKAAIREDWWRIVEKNTAPGEYAMKEDYIQGRVGTKLDPWKPFTVGANTQNLIVLLH